MKRTRLWLFFVLAAGLAGCGPGTHPSAPVRATAGPAGGEVTMNRLNDAVPTGPQPLLEEITIILPSGARVAAEYADDPLEREIGLMGRTSLAPMHGMLLVADGDEPMPIWMMNCFFPLDLVWIEKGGRIAGVMEDVPPCRAEPCPVYDPGAAVRYVLELPTGTVRSEGLRAGSQVRFIDVLDSPARD